MSGTEPQWLIWAREIQGVAQTGLAFSKDPYDLERYHALRDLSVRIVREHTGVDPVRIADLFASDTGYASPKLGVRAGVFDADGRILMVRETSDGGWTLPGGWGEVNQTPAESVVREVFEESGLAVRLQAFLLDVRRTQTYTRYYVAKRIGGCPSAMGW